MALSRVPLVLSAVLVLAACEGPAPEEPSEAAPELLARHGGRGPRRDAGRPCPEQPPVCLFGSQFSDLRTSPVLAIESEIWIRSEAELGGELEAAQLVLAVQQSSHTDVTTAAEALARVDQQEVRRMELVEARGSAREQNNVEARASAPEQNNIETSGDRAFTVYEYGVGDNSYGAIFAAGSTELAASIHDGDLLACNVYTAN